MLQIAKWFLTILLAMLGFLLISILLTSWILPSDGKPRTSAAPRENAPYSQKKSPKPKVHTEPILDDQGKPSERGVAPEPSSRRHQGKSGTHVPLKQAVDIAAEPAELPRKTKAISNAQKEHVLTKKEARTWDALRTQGPSKGQEQKKRPRAHSEVGSKQTQVVPSETALQAIDTNRKPVEGLSLTKDEPPLPVKDAPQVDRNTPSSIKKSDHTYTEYFSYGSSLPNTFIGSRETDQKQQQGGDIADALPERQQIPLRPRLRPSLETSETPQRATPKKETKTYVDQSARSLPSPSSSPKASNTAESSPVIIGVFDLGSDAWVLIEAPDGQIHEVRKGFTINGFLISEISGNKVWFTSKQKNFVREAGDPLR